MKVNGDYLWGTVHWVGTYDGKPACGVSGNNFGGIWAWDGSWKLVHRAYFWSKVAEHIETSGRAVPATTSTLAVINDVDAFDACWRE